MGIGGLAVTCDGAIEARQRLLGLAEFGQRPPQQDVRPRPLRLHRQRAPHQIDALGEPALLTAYLRKVIERRRVGGSSCSTRA